MDSHHHHHFSDHSRRQNQCCNQPEEQIPFNFISKTHRTQQQQQQQQQTMDCFSTTFSSSLDVSSFDTKKLQRIRSLLPRGMMLGCMMMIVTLLDSHNFTGSVVNAYSIRTIPLSTTIQRQHCNGIITSSSSDHHRHPILTTSRSFSSLKQTSRLILSESMGTNGDKDKNVEWNVELQTLLSFDSSTTTGTSNDDKNSNQKKTMKKNTLQPAIDFLREHQSSIQLSRETWDTIFRAIEIRTANAEEYDAVNNNNNIVGSATTTPATEFPYQSYARQEMTELYTVLKEMKQLQWYGAASTSTPPPTISTINDSTSLTTLRQLPAGGSYTLPPNLFETIVNIPVTSLAPQQSSMNNLLYAGIGAALLEGGISIMTGVSFNTIVFGTLSFFLCDRFFFNGAIAESTMKILVPTLQEKVTKHEAGHFLIAYLLGCPVEGIVLSSWAALQDKRFGNRAVSAGTSFFDPELSKQMNQGRTNSNPAMNSNNGIMMTGMGGSGGGPQLTRSSIDRYSIIVMAGIAAEAIHYGQADGGAGDEMALIAFLSQLSGRQNNRSTTGTTIWNPDQIRNQARWGALQAILLLKTYQPAYDALVDTLERGGQLGDCIYAIEKAGRDYQLPKLVQPMGCIMDNMNNNNMNDSIEWITDLQKMQQQNNNAQNNNVVGLPVVVEKKVIEFNRDEAKESLQQYRLEMEQKLRDVEKKLQELQ